MVCYSEDGELTGCREGHVICGSCLRAGLRHLSGDVLDIDGLLCGCFDQSNAGTLGALATRADANLQDLILNPPQDVQAKAELQAEIEQTKARWNIRTKRLDRALYQSKVTEWFDRVRELQLAPLYHVCVHPACASSIDCWMLREDFDRDFRSRGITTWDCPRGHHNTVLPTQAELDAANLNIMMHPEYKVTGSIPMRQYRICPGCITEGTLMIAEHASGCKHWPGSGSSAHKHVMCFACCRTWDSECSHGAAGCIDPGMQQVRRVGDILEVGYLSGMEYIRWLKNETRACPVTRFPSGQERGSDRQARLGLTNKAELLAESNKGVPPAPTVHYSS